MNFFLVESYDFIVGKYIFLLSQLLEIVDPIIGLF